jgi:hypothetical protein
LGGEGETRASVTESLAFADSLQLDTVKHSSALSLEAGIITPADDLLYPRFYLAE